MYSTVTAQATQLGEEICYQHGILLAVLEAMRRGRESLALLSAICAWSVGCSGTAPGGPDGGREADAGVVSTGLAFSWSAVPTPPADVEDDLELTDVQFRLRAIRAVGDAAPGDERTTRDSLNIRWAEDDEPSVLSFENAPPGFYSQFEFRIDGGGGDESVAFKGRVRINGTWEDFQIDDERVSGVSLSLQDLQLAAGENQTVEIIFDLKDAFDSIEWENAPIDDGKRTIEADDAQLDIFREKLLEKISVGTVTTTILN